MIQHVLICSPEPEYVHWQGLAEIALPIAYSLRALGHPAEVTIDPSVCVGKTLVFGAHLIPKFKGTIEGGDYIIFNLEQVTEGSPWITAGYIDILKKYEAWDYSLSNIAQLAKLGVTARHCEIGYHPCMSNIRVEKSATLTGGGTVPLRVDYVNWSSVGLPVGVFDVLFYGSMNARRQKIIDDLREAGKNVVVTNGYGAWRDKYVRTAKIVLNMGFYDSAIFNICRIAPLLANQKCVVSEESNEAYSEGVAFAPYDGLVAKCLELLSDDVVREDLAKRGFEEIKKHNQIEILRPLVC